MNRNATFKTWLCMMLKLGEFGKYTRNIFKVYGPGVDSACNRNEYQGHLLGSKGGQCVGLTTLPPSCAGCLEILKASTSWSPPGLSTPVMGLLYLYVLHLGRSDMRCWRRMQKISWTDRVRIEEVLHRVKEERNIVHTIKRRKANRIGHILRRNCLLKHVTEEKIERTERQARRRKQLVDDLKETRGYWKLKEEALDRTLGRSRFGRGYSPVARQTAQ
jgi:hypothetical protein